MVAIYVIGLEKAKERRQKIDAELSAHGIQATFLSAIPKDSLSIDVSYPLDRMTLGEIACRLSHLEAHAVIAKSGQGGVILEDDVSPASNIRKFLSHLQKNKTAYEDIPIVHLASGHPGSKINDHFTKLILIENLKLHKVIIFGKELSGASAYWISLESARQSIKRREIILADSWRMQAMNGIFDSIFIVQEKVFHHPEDLQESTLESDRAAFFEQRKSKTKRWIKLLIRLQRIWRGFSSIGINN